MVNKNKTDLTLVPAELIYGAARAFEDGLKKPGRYAFNWKDVGLTIRDVGASLMRHTALYLDGQDLDEESGLCHLDHIAANAAMLMALRKMGKLVDDRWKK